MTKNQNPYDEFVNIDYASFSDWIFSFTGNEYAIISAIIGILIATPLNLNQQNSIGNFFECIGQIILTINAQEINRRVTINPNDSEISNRQYTINQNAQNINLNNDRLNNLENQINRLFEELNKKNR